VVNQVSLADEAFQRGDVENGIVDEVKVLALQVVFDVGDLAHGKVVYDSDLVALLRQDVHQVGTDEASTAGYENSHFIPLMYLTLNA
jgi:hypothetical protein